MEKVNHLTDVYMLYKIEAGRVIFTLMLKDDVV